jgi:hypothetical protein
MRHREHGTSTASTIAAVKFLVRALLVVFLRIEVKVRPLTDISKSVEQWS